MLGSRARLTVPDVLFLLVSLAIFGVLFPIIVDGLNRNAGNMTQGTTMLFSLIGPLVALVLLAVTYRKAVVGA